MALNHANMVFLKDFTTKIKGYFNVSFIWIFFTVIFNYY